MDFEILIMDDKIADATSASDILSELAHVKTLPTDEIEKALTLIERSPRRFALVMIDFNLEMKNLDGLALAQKIWKINPKQLIAIFSGTKSSEAPIKCVGTPIVEFIEKGIPGTILQKKVQSLLRKFEATQTVRNVTQESSDNQKICSEAGIISRSASVADVTKTIFKVAAKDAATVLILGETGTGKELAAKSIHNLSPRKDKPFVAINMGAFQSSLIESELFGHEKGSFTGASQAHKGAFERANGGTIFLDEIGELSHDLQVKLLRVLQEREVQPVGSTKTMKIDVRVIAATHVDLNEKIKAEKFRLDLYQRLNVVTLKIPSLRERKDDIGLLTTYFLNKFNSTKTISPLTLKHLENYNWPGNIRELENLVQRLDIIVDDAEIQPEHLPSEIFVQLNEPQDATKVNFAVDHDTFSQWITNLEREYFIYNLSNSKSARDAAINRFKIAPSTLADKLKSHNIIYKSKVQENPNKQNEEETHV